MHPNISPNPIPLNQAPVWPIPNAYSREKLKAKGNIPKNAVRMANVKAEYTETASTIGSLVNQHNSWPRECYCKNEF